MELQPAGGGQLLHRDAVVSNHLDVLHQRLSSLLNVDHNIDLRIVYHDLGRYLGIFISTIAIEGLQIVRTLVRKFLAHAAVGPEPEMSLFYGDPSHKILL